jgi:uncharacterized membrane protein
MNNYFLLSAALFPAMPLMMINFGNRYTTLSALIRKIHDELTECNWQEKEAASASNYLKQIDILRKRLLLNRLTSTLAALAFITNLLALFISVNAVPLDFVTTFSSSIILFASAMVLFIVEIQIATKALDAHIEDLEEIKLWQSKKKK